MNNFLVSSSSQGGLIPAKMFPSEKEAREYVFQEMTDILSRYKNNTYILPEAKKMVSGYILFGLEKREEYPNLKGKIGSVQISEQWLQLTDSEKQRYNSLAREKNNLQSVNIDIDPKQFDQENTFQARNRYLSWGKDKKDRYYVCYGNNSEDLNADYQWLIHLP